MENATPAFPLFGILGVIFIVLKLTGVGSVAGWSWLWVLSPFWIPLVLAFVAFFVIIASIAIIGLFR